MTDTQILTVVLAATPTFIIVLIGILLNNARLNDLRDLLRAEMSKNQSEILAKFAELDGRLTRLEARFGS